MKIQLLSFFTLLLLFTHSIAYASEPVPFDDFVKITEQALDSLDEIETIFSSSDSTKMEARLALKKFNTAMKKYDRYITSWPKSTQGEIAFTMTKARLAYDLTLMKGLYGKSHDEANQLTQEARDMFMKYKNERTQKDCKKTKK